MSEETVKKTETKKAKETFTNRKLKAINTMRNKAKARQLAERLLNTGVK